MKKILYPIAILAAMAVVFTSCRTDDDPLEIRVNRSILEFPYGGGTQTFTLVASEGWRAAGVNISEGWQIALSATQGEATEGLVITVFADSTNPSYLARTGRLRFTLQPSQIFVEIELYQAGNPTGITDITGAWTVTSWDHTGEQITDLDTITRSRYNAKQFHVFGFLGEPRPVIEWNGADFIYITKRLPDWNNNPFWQAPFAVIADDDAGELDGGVFRIADSVAILRYSTNMLDGDYWIDLVIDGSTFDALLLFATMDRDPNAANFNFNNDAMDIIESPRFTRGGASNAPRRAPIQGRAGAGTIIEVSPDSHVGNINDVKNRRR
ncbi:MAG: BACON domain-containing protein [Bacteroidales bacterium]|nr:BACON domain-containing protein [Bacteroidales bacterium]